MPSFATQRRVPFSASQMLAVVADVERYPEFLPLCQSLKILSRRDLADGYELVARMGVGYKAIAESYTSRVVVRPGEQRVDVRHIEGPFRRLENVWRFRDTTDGHSIVDFSIDYEFSSPLLAIVVGGVFDQAVRQFTTAFEERARDIYGRPPISV